MALSKTLLLIGMGSIGATHLQKASKIYKKITVVDIDESKRLKVLELGILLGIETTYLENLNQLDQGSSFDLIVIANWGPDHVSTYKQISEFSENFLIEKPLASKISDLQFLREEVSKGKVIITNLQWNYSGFKERVGTLQNLHHLGALCGFQLLGGAKCLVTNGIHYLSLASILLEEYPTSVMAMINATRINPRRQDFLYYEGVVSWAYSSDRYLSMQLHNGSHVSETFRVIFQNGIIEVKKGKMSALVIPLEDRKVLSRPTKTLHPSKISEPVEAFTLGHERDGLDVIYEMFRDHRHTPKGFDSGYLSTLGIIASLVSSDHKTAINIRQLELLDNELTVNDWNIT